MRLHEPYVVEKPAQKMPHLYFVPHNHYQHLFNSNEIITLLYFSSLLHKRFDFLLGDYCNLFHKQINNFLLCSRRETKFYLFICSFKKNLK